MEVKNNYLASRICAGLNQISKTNEKIGHIWKLPSSYDSLLFAITEIGEVVNDEINTKQSKYARNNNQDQPDVAAELADAGMMLTCYFFAQQAEKLGGLTDENRERARINTLAYLEELSNTLASDDAIIFRAGFYGEESRIPLTHTASGGLLVDTVNYYEAELIPMIGLLTWTGRYLLDLAEIVYDRQSTVDGLLFFALALVVTHPIFLEKRYNDYLYEKLQRTIKKVESKAMKIV